MTTNEKFYVGVDWGSEKHAACVTNADGKILGERFFEHSGEWARRDVHAGSSISQARRTGSAFVVGIEVPRGPVVSTSARTWNGGSLHQSEAE